jgi:DNA-binding NarL/FixJ family response regulator
LIVALRCLIIDDNLGFLGAARAVLEQEGLQVVGVASTGVEGARRVAELRPDVTLIDVRLGERSGFDLARQLASDLTLDVGNIILISSHEEDDFAELIEASPAIGFVGKLMLSGSAIEALVCEAGGGCGSPRG